MDTPLKRLFSALLSAALLVVSPGLGAYDASAQAVKSGAAFHPKSISHVVIAGWDSSRAFSLHNLSSGAEAHAGNQAVHLEYAPNLPLPGGESAGLPLLWGAAVFYAPAPDIIVQHNAAPLSKAPMAGTHAGGFAAGGAAFHEAPAQAQTLATTVHSFNTGASTPENALDQLYVGSQHSGSWQAGPAQAQSLARPFTTSGLAFRSSAHVEVAQNIPAPTPSGSFPAASHQALLHSPLLWLALGATALWTWKGARILREVLPGWTGRQAAEAANGKPPAAIWMFFMGSIPYAFSTWMGASVLPIDAQTIAPILTLVSQGLVFVSVYLGSKTGAGWAKRGWDKGAFITATLVTALGLLAVAAAHALDVSMRIFVGIFIPARIAAGFAGGALMAVGEKAIVSRIAGAKQAWLDQGNSLYMAAYWPMALLASGLGAFLWKAWGIEPLAILGGLAGLIAIPFIQAIEFPDKLARIGPAASAPVPQPGTGSLTLGHKSAFIFSTFIRIASFGLVGPVIGALFAPWMAAAIIACYALGSFIAAIPLGFNLPSVNQRLRQFHLGWVLDMDKTQWLAFNVASWALFLIASLTAGSWILTLAVAVALGFASTGALIRWTTFIQLPRPDVNIKETFSRLFNAALGILIGIFALLVAYPFIKYYGTPQSAHLRNVLRLHLLPWSLWLTAVGGAAAWLSAKYSGPSRRGQAPVGNTRADVPAAQTEQRTQ